MTFSSEYSSRREIGDVSLPRANPATQASQLISRSVRPLQHALENLVTRFLLTLDPETAHNLTIKLVQASDRLTPSPQEDDGRLSQRLFGIDFKNPIGAAAGLDKDGEIWSILLRKYGFGFVEIGTITPKPQ